MSEALRKTDSPSGPIHRPDDRIPSRAVSEHALDLPRRTSYRLFDQLVSEGMAWRDPHGVRFFHPGHPLIRKRLIEQAGRADDTWERAPREQRDEALAWCRFIEAVEDRAGELVQGHGRQEALRRACVDVGSEVLGFVVPLATFYGRRKRYVAADRARSSMLDNRGSHNKGSGMSPEARAEFEKLYLDKRRRSVRWCWRAVSAKARKCGWSWPSYRAVARWVSRTWPDAKADYYRLGAREWTRRHAPKIIRDKSDQRGNEVVEIDHARADFWCRYGANKRVRPWYTLIIDRATNVILGHAITTNPSSTSLAIAWRRAVTIYGAPAEVYLDNGEDMKSGGFGNKRRTINPEWARGTLEQCGCELHWCTPYQPWTKGSVEAAARVIHQDFDVAFPSYCGGHIDRRPEGLDKWCNDHLEELPTLGEVEELFASWLDVYHARPRRWPDGVDESAHARFERTRIAKRTIPDHILNVLLLPLTSRRKVTAKGVLRNGLYYASDRLFELQGQEVRLRWVPEDITRVYICDLAGKPLFMATQNVVRGTDDDVRRAMTRRARARRAVRDGRESLFASLADTPESIIQAQAEFYNVPSRPAGKPKPPSPADTVAPIRTPEAEAVSGASDVIQREERRAAAEARRPVNGGSNRRRLAFEDIANSIEGADHKSPSGRSMLFDFVESDGEDDGRMDAAPSSPMNQLIHGLLYGTEADDDEQQAQAG